LVRVGDELLLVDTAWSDAQTREILEWAESTIGVPVSRAVVTHAHDDKMGGMEALHEREIATFASSQTNLAAVKGGLTPAQQGIDLAPTFLLLEGVEAFYPGPGHTVDNIVVYVAGAKVLFAGCLVRPAEATTLGNTADADVDHWAEAVRKVRARYPDAAIVVPSHGGWADRSLLDHTIELASETAGAD
jgi:glyoxylase-like metal-dependent hydrolase (beta-lactamase superfamily II)